MQHDDLSECQEEESDYEFKPSQDNSTNYSDVVDENIVLETRDHFFEITKEAPELLKEEHGHKFGYVKGHLERFLKRAILYFSEPRPNLYAIMLFPHYPDRLFLEVDSTQDIRKMYTHDKVTEVTFGFFSRLFCNAPFSLFSIYNERRFGYVHFPPYNGDICEILDVDVMKKKFLIKVLPRINYKEGGYSVKRPKAFDPKLFLGKVRVASIRVSYVFYKAASGYNYRGREFVGIHEIINVPTINVSVGDTNITEEEKMSFGLPLTTYVLIPDGQLTRDQYLACKSHTTFTIAICRPALAPVKILVPNPPPTIISKKGAKRVFGPASSYLDPTMAIPLPLIRQYDLLDGQLVKNIYDEVGVIIDVGRRLRILMTTGELRVVKQGTHLDRIKDDDSCVDKKGSKVQVGDTIDLGNKTFAKVVHTYRQRTFAVMEDRNFWTTKKAFIKV